MILYFTGTGNSAFIAKRIAEKYLEWGENMDISKELKKYVRGGMTV